MPQGLEDVSKYPFLLAELLASDRWSEEDIGKLAGKNLIRVFRQVEQVNGRDQISFFIQSVEQPNFPYFHFAGTRFAGGARNVANRSINIT